MKRLIRGLDDLCRQGETGIFVIDMQPDFLDQVFFFTELMLHSNIRCVLDYAIDNDIPLIEVQTETEVDNYGETIGPVRRKILEAPRHFLFTKSKDDALSNPDVLRQVSKLNLSRIFLMGIYAKFCVYATARSLFYNGYKVFTSNQVLGECKWGYLNLESKERRERQRWYRKNVDFI